MENPKSITEAIASLNDVIKDNSQELKMMLGKDIQEIKKALSVINPEYVKDKIVDTTQDAIKDINGKAHSNPWYFIGGAGLLMGVFGFILGKKSS